MRTLKNESRTRGQPGDDMVAKATNAANTTVETIATNVERLARERRYASRSVASAVT
jgi:hypothetical protein